MIRAMSVYGGIDLGGTKIQTILVAGETREMLGQARNLTPRSGGPEAVVEEIVASVRDAATQAGIEPGRLDAIGLGSPGEVDARAGVVAHARNLPGWEGSFPLAAALSQRLGTKVKLGGDVAVATEAEVEQGAGRQARSLLGVFWGTGVGGAVVLERKLWRGRGGAGEIGHMVVKRGGARCTCGRRGCLEAYAGRRAMEERVMRLTKRGRKTDLLKIMRKKDHDTLSSGVWGDALKHGDKLATELIDRAVEALGAGVASAVNLLDVELVVLGGGLGTRFGEPMAQRIADAMQPHLFNDERPPRVCVAELGDLGGALGAAMLAQRRVRAPRAPRRRSSQRGS